MAIVVICKDKSGGHLYLERGEFSWVDGRISAATYPTVAAAQKVADKVNERSERNAWRGPARVVMTGA